MSDLFRRIFGAGDWSVVVWSGNLPRYDQPERRHRFYVVRHIPQSNAATIFTGLSKARAERQALRLNQLNSSETRARQLAVFEETK